MRPADAQPAPPVRRGRKPVVGLVGGIGSGKSVVARLFAELGAAVVDADQLGHEALRQPAIRQAVADRWGPDVLDGAGEVDRRKLAARVFADPAERQALEALVLPEIRRRTAAALDEAERDPAKTMIVLDAAILLETGWRQVCDRIVYVDTPRDERLRRVAAGRGWTTQEVEAREAAQWPVARKAALADAVIDNAGGLAHTRRQVADEYRRIQQLFPLHPSSDARTEG
jgi:dephospho-CoA kinase